MDNSPQLTAEEESQKQYYKQIADEYDRHYANPYALRYRYTQYDLCLGDLDLRGNNALDAMCGGGEAMDYLLRHGAH